MAGTYNLKSFLRKADKELLRRYLAEKVIGQACQGNMPRKRHICRTAK